MKKDIAKRKVRVMFGIGLHTPKWVILEILAKLPEDAVIVDIVSDPTRHQYGWMVASESFKELDEGAIIPPAYVKVDGVKKTVDMHFEATADNFMDALDSF